jgi:hypothetical protein
VRYTVITTFYDDVLFNPAARITRTERVTGTPIAALAAAIRQNNTPDDREIAIHREPTGQKADLAELVAVARDTSTSPHTRRQWITTMVELIHGWVFPWDDWPRLEPPPPVYWEQAADNWARLSPAAPPEDLVAALGARSDMSGHMVFVHAARLRVREHWPAVIEVEDDAGVTALIGPFAGISGALAYAGVRLPSCGPRRHRFLSVVPPEAAPDHALALTQGITTDDEPPLLALLRAAINPHGHEPGEDAELDCLLAHLRGHRPVQLYDARCLDDECEHADNAADGRCHRPTELGTACWGCSAIYAPGGEWGASPLPGCTISWPCQVMLTTAERYSIDITAHRPRHFPPQAV